jgi:4-hydroxy-tetrahydrodipicolinate synthase
MAERLADAKREGNWRGIIPVVPTPFHHDGGLDLASYRAHVDRLIRAEVDAVIALGTAGEGPSMTIGEWEQVVASAVEASGGRVQVLAGLGGPNEAATLDAIRRLESCGLAGLLLATPSLYPLTREELIGYFQRVAGVTRLPVMVYNSTYTGTPLRPDMLEELADRLPNFVALKEGNQAQASDVIRRLRGRVGVFASRDLHIQEVLAAGGAGAIAFTANIVPEMVVRLYKTAAAGDVREARSLQDALNPLVWAVVSRSFPAGLKAGMDLTGSTGGFVRAPLSDFTPEERSHLTELIDHVRLVLGAPV